mgnify:CR=1 FL=1
MAQIATVMAVNGSGTAVIVDANGNTRPAVAGAPVMRGETVRTTGGARVELMMEDGDVVAINPNQTVRVDENMAQGDARPTPQEGGVTLSPVTDGYRVCTARPGRYTLLLQHAFETTAGQAPERLRWPVQTDITAL